MAATQQQFYPAPFDAVAERYDETFTFSTIGQLQRNAVWAELGKTFRPGSRVLEIGCGTGIDACFLAKRGVRLVACDSSSRMIAVAERRIQQNHLQKFVQPIQLAAEEIDALHVSEPFDGAFSNFGALNCVEDIQKFASDLSKLLKPGTNALLCWMGPCCLWEMAWYLAEGKPKKAFRRLNRQGTVARVGEGPQFVVRYPTIRQLTRVFSGKFRLLWIQGIGVAVPPSYMESWGIRHRRTLRLFEKADSFLGRTPGCRVLADHVLLNFERKNTP